MTIAAEDVPILKVWLVKRSKELSEADSDVLADYILLLLENDLIKEELIKLLKEELAEFTDKNEQFATEIVETLEKRSFIINEDEKKKLLDPEQKEKLRKEQAIEFTTKHYKIDRSSYATTKTKIVYVNKQQQRNKGDHRLDPEVQEARVARSETLRKKQKEQLENVVGSIKNPPKRGDTVIVTNIPIDKLYDNIITSYFSRFGEISNLSITKSTRIAEIKFKDTTSAKMAWGCATPIFNNRFVKVFFKKIDVSDKNTSSEDGEQLPDQDQEQEQEQQEQEQESFDIEAFKLSQAQKQKEFEEKKRKQDEYNNKLKALIKMKEGVLKQYDLELAKLQQSLANEPSLENEIAAKMKQIHTEMINNGVTPQQIAQDRAKLEGKASFSSLRGKIQQIGYSKGAAAKYSPYSRPTAVPNKKLDLRTRTVLLKNFNDFNNSALQRTISEIVGNNNVESNEVKNGNDLSITFKERFLAERFFKFDFKPFEDSQSIQKEWDETNRPVASNQAGAIDESNDVNVGL